MTPQQIEVLLLRFSAHKTLLETAQAMRIPITEVIALTESAFDKLERLLVAA